MKNCTQRKIYAPIIFLLLWLGFTIFTFSFGPYAYNLTNPFEFYIYLLVIHLLLFLGYRSGLKSNVKKLRININYLDFVKKTVVISLIYGVFKIIITSGGDALNFSATFADASTTYENSNLKNTSLFSYIDIIFYPISLIAITNTIFSNKKLSWPYRLSVYFLIALSILSSIGSATRSGIVGTAMITMASFYLGVCKRNIILQKRHKALLLLIILFCSLAFLSYTSLLVASRGGFSVANPLTGDQPVENYFLDYIVPAEFEPVVDSIAFYISHSYYRLNQAMNMSFEGLGFGLSNSMFVMNNIEKITGWSGLKEISYGVRLDEGEGEGNYGLYWSTFYTWIASDVTFPGVGVVVFSIGYFFSMSLRDSLKISNPFSVTAFCLLFYFIFHFGFNNPLQDGQGISTYLVIPAIWLILRKNSD